MKLSINTKFRGLRLFARRGPKGIYLSQTLGGVWHINLFRTAGGFHLTVVRGETGSRSPMQRLPASLDGDSGVVEIGDLRFTVTSEEVVGGGDPFEGEPSKSPRYILGLDRAIEVADLEAELAKVVARRPAGSGLVASTPTPTPGGEVTPGGEATPAPTPAPTPEGETTPTPTPTVTVTVTPEGEIPF